MKRRFLLAVLLCACAHEQLVPEEAELAKEQPATFAEGTVPPVRKKCRKGGPRLGERDRASGRLVLDYVITEEGKVKPSAHSSPPARTSRRRRTGSRSP